MERAIYCHRGNIMENKISKSEEEMIENAIARILEGEVTDQKIYETLPMNDDLADANKIYKGKCSVLFVDIRDSTLLPEQFQDEDLVRIYRSYTRCIIQGIRYSGGVVRDFMGDGVLAIFVDDEVGESEEKSVRAARYIATVIDKFLNPELKNRLNGFCVSCGIGISTGSIMMTKVGMKGKENDQEAENEYGIAWIGNSTNYACKYSGLVSNETIYIDEKTFSKIECNNKDWKYVEYIKGKNLFKGYIAEEFYLSLDDEHEACRREKKQSDDEKQTILDNLNTIYEKHMSSISKKSEEAGRVEEKNRQDAKKNSDFYLELKDKESDLKDERIRLLEDRYDFYFSVVTGAHCKKDYVLVMKKEFWEKNLQEMFSVGGMLGKSESEMKTDISYAMVDIYQNLELYVDAYMYLVEQARGYAWLNGNTVEKIVKKTGCHSALVDTLCERLRKGNIADNHKSGFLDAKNVLIKLGYWQ